jgi:hypothetical protein
MMAKQHDDGLPGDAWVEVLLRKDAEHLKGADDPDFTAVVMNSLALRPPFERSHLAGVALSGLAAAITAVCITWQLPALLNAIVTAVDAEQPQPLLAASAPFVLLVGFSWFAYRVGANRTNDHSGGSYA